MRIAIVVLALGVAVSFVSCKDKGNKAVLTEQRVEVVKPVQKEVDTEKKREESKPAKQMNYYVVAGCFEFKENAERLHVALKDKGYDSQIFPFYNLTMVTYNGFATREEAQVALNKLVAEPDKELAWVYPVK